MNNTAATKIFESLSSAVRLDVFRLLVKFAPDGLVAGEIGEKLQVPPTNLSFHLKGLTQAGLVSVRQEGRFQRYTASIPLMLELIAYLTEECCSGNPGQCETFRAAKPGLKKVLPPLTVKKSKRKS